MNKDNLNIHDWLLTKAEVNQKRYIEAERFICKLFDMPWYKKILFIFYMDKEILNFIRSRDKFDKM